MSIINLLKKTCRKTLFTTPSHSQHFFIFNKFRNFYKYDISETEAHNPQDALKKAQEKASEIYGTKATYFLTNGSTSGVIASVLACVSVGDNVLLWRDAHRCHHNAVRLAGANPIYYDLEIDKNFGVPLATQPELIEKFLNKNKIKAVIITSPTYEGIVSDIKEIKNICQKYGARLIVDEAHGALYPFCDKLPISSVNIADFTVQSLHKTAGGLNPTALLHCNCDLDVQKSLDMINTTSPSYPILATIEKNINYLNSKKGRQYIDSLISKIEQIKKNCKNFEFFGDDSTKVLMKHKNLTGNELSEILFKKYGIEDEKSNEKSVMLLCGIGTDIKKLDRLAKIINNCKDF